MSRYVFKHIQSAITVLLLSAAGWTLGAEDVKCDKSFPTIGGCINDKCPDGYTCNNAEYTCCIAEKTNGLPVSVSAPVTSPSTSAQLPQPPGPSAAVNLSPQGQPQQSSSASGSADRSDSTGGVSAQQNQPSSQQQQVVRQQQQRQLDQALRQYQLQLQQAQQSQGQQQQQQQPGQQSAQQLQQPPTVARVANINPPYPIVNGVAPPQNGYYTVGQLVAPLSSQQFSQQQSSQQLSSQQH